MSDNEKQTEQVPAEQVPVQEAMRRVMEDVGVVGKNARMDSGGRGPSYAFRSHDDVVAAVQPALVRHGVVVTPRVVDQYREMIERDGRSAMFHVALLVEFTFTGPMGDSLQACTSGEALDTSDKASNKAMTAAHKYALTMALSIPTEGDEHESVREEVGAGARRHGGGERQPPPRGEHQTVPARGRDCPACGDTLSDGTPVVKSDGMLVHKACVPGDSSD